MVLELTNYNFENQIKKTNKIILIDFWASWCSPCQVLGPIIDELEKEYEEKVLIAKVDVDNNQDLAKKYDIKSIPTLLFFKDEILLDKVIGIMTKEQIKEKLNDLIKKFNSKID